MISVRYRQIVTVGVLHEYYMKKYCRDLSFIPTSSTLKTFRKYGMLMKKLPNGFTVLAIDDGTLTDIEENDNDNILEFIVKSNNPYFYHISDILFNQDLKGKKVRTEEKGEDGKIVIKEVIVEAEENEEVEAQLVAMVRRKFIFNNKKNSVSDDYKLLHLENFVSVTDLNKDIPHVRDEDFGLLQIKLKGVEDNNYGIIVNDEIIHQTYTIHFDCRKAFWRYYIISRTEKEYTAFQIVSKDNKKFTEPNLKHINALGKKVPTIISEEMLEIKERSNLKFRLQFSEKNEDRISSKAKKLNISLPSPEVRNVKPADKKNKTVHGDMYVYI